MPSTQRSSRKSLVTLVSGAMGGEAHLSAALALVGVAVSVISVLGFLFAVRNAPRSFHEPVGQV